MCCVLALLHTISFVSPHNISTIYCGITTVDTVSVHSGRRRSEFARCMLFQYTPSLLAQYTPVMLTERQALWSSLHWIYGG